MRSRLSLFALACTLVLQASAARGLSVDDFESLQVWSAHPADGVQLELVSDAGRVGRAMRLDFRFSGGGYAIARRELDLQLVENYEFRFWLRGESPSNHLEFKLIDASGENVWWNVDRDVEFSDEWQQIRIKKRQITFAWGPSGGGELGQVAALEFAVTAGSGGEGRIWIDQLELVSLPPDDEPLPDPLVTASSAQMQWLPSQCLDGDSGSHWSPASEDLSPWLLIDFVRPREFSALILDWPPGFRARTYLVEASYDSVSWWELRKVTDGAGVRDGLFLPDSEARFLRFRFAKQTDREAIRLTEIKVQPVEWASSREQFFERIAAESPRGCYPRGFSGEQSYWTLVGLDGGEDEGLLSEDGALELRQGSFSVEPFLRIGDRFVSWADVEAEQSLEGGDLPLPSVVWEYGDLRLNIQSLALGQDDASAIAARYSVENLGGSELELTFYLAVRPFQVNPPSQQLNRGGGTAPLASLEARGNTVWVNGVDRLVSLTPYSEFGCTAFDAGEVVTDHLRRGTMPGSNRIEDPFEAASGALAYALRIPAGEMADVQILLPQSPSYELPEPDFAEEWFERQLEASVSSWREATHRVRVELPESAARIEQTLYAQLAYILVNRDGAAIQPGSRSYARSWIRDGALTSTALLRLQRADVVREFLGWYAGHQYDNGKIPCVVDHRGADPVPEHDSSGEFIYLVAEYYRHTRDLDLTLEMWPRVWSAVAYLDSLRHERLGAPYDSVDNAPLRGILPPSISHEGYSAKPMHSYWDDFFALLGFDDAIYLAGELQQADDERVLTVIRDEFADDLAASVRATMDRHSIDYIPGCADLGDFDATSTTIVFDPTHAAKLLPMGAVERTFERYDEFFEDRRQTGDWTAFTPYEIRNVGAFVRLGWRDRAHDLIEFFLAQQKPRAWLQWPEVVFQRDREPHFIGDLPHTWVGSDYVRSILDLFAYEGDAPRALIVGAGVPRAWVDDPAGLLVEGLSTGYGLLDLNMRVTSRGLEVHVAGLDRIPPGGVILRPPVLASHPFPDPSLSSDWRPESDGPGVVVRSLPATVIWPWEQTTSP